MTPPPLWNFSENSSILEGEGVPYPHAIKSEYSTYSPTCNQIVYLCRLCSLYGQISEGGRKRLQLWAALNWGFLQYRCAQSRWKQTGEKPGDLAWVVSPSTGCRIDPDDPIRDHLDPGQWPDTIFFKAKLCLQKTLSNFHKMYTTPIV